MYFSFAADCAVDFAEGFALTAGVVFKPVIAGAFISRAFTAVMLAKTTPDAKQQVSNNFLTAVRPQIIKSYAEGDLEAMMKLVKQSSCFSFYLMWIITLPIFLESDYILTLWLRHYPEHTVSFLHLVLILCLIQTLKTPRSTVFHATGHLKFVNLVVGGILCAAFPLAYILLKFGFSPESVFYAANATMLVSEAASIIILKKYINYSILDYVKVVYGRCILVVATSFIIPFLFYQNITSPGFVRLISTCIITTFSSVFFIYCFGMNNVERKKIRNIICRKLRK